MYSSGRVEVSACVSPGSWEEKGERPVVILLVFPGSFWDKDIGLVAELQLSAKGISSRFSRFVGVVPEVLGLRRSNVCRGSLLSCSSCSGAWQGGDDAVGAGSCFPLVATVTTRSSIATLSSTMHHLAVADPIWPGSSIRLIGRFVFVRFCQSSGPFNTLNSVNWCQLSAYFDFIALALVVMGVIILPRIHLPAGWSS